MVNIDALLPQIAGALDVPRACISYCPVSGGDISQCYRLDAGRRAIFLKCLPERYGRVLQAEELALKAIADSGMIRCPLVLAAGGNQGLNWLALEHLELKSRSDTADRQLGRQLANLHRGTADRFGWPQDNYIGLTPQHNPWHDVWDEFFIQQRLAPQIRWLQQANPGWNPGAEKSLKKCAALLEGHRPEAALLHGDLWAGNAAMLADQTPVIFDPASYYGDRETDLAMMALFGGYSVTCFESYQDAWPLPDGYRRRLPIYQLYHILNHANLFAGSYLQQAARLLDQISRN